MILDELQREQAALLDQDCRWQQQQRNIFGLGRLISQSLAI
jgi:hypothetical protein